MGNLSINRILPGHYDLDIQPDLIYNVIASFRQLADDGQLKHGTGKHNFGSLNIRL